MMIWFGFVVIWLLLGSLGRRPFMNDFRRINVIFGMNPEDQPSYIYVFSWLYILVGPLYPLVAILKSLIDGVNLFTWTPEKE
jgi:hypothetical protein